MSIVTRPKRLNPASFSQEPSNSAPTANIPRCDTEAPDRGISRHEAPETLQGQHCEGPDAGGGRASFLEHEFTHGRSQS